PFVARVLAERTKVGELRMVTDQPAFLAPLDVETLPLDPRVAQDLRLLGIVTVGAFAALDRGSVGDRFGRGAAYAHALASGDDPSDVGATPPRRRIRSRRRSFEPIASKEQLVFFLRRIADEVAAGLARDGLAALRVALVLEREKDGALAVVAAAPLRLDRLLLPPTADAAAIVRSLRWALDEWPELGCVTGASVEVTEAEPLRGRQLGLFAADGARLEEAIGVAQHLRGRLGPGAVLRARVADPDARLPEREGEWSEVVA
ncbi:MAG TPA: hypothetical protein VFM93_13945, partial [Candidatus Limnocylindria bacterium]|nr:hypothetical protein [Candidatus Limnocylindria bacterium]